MRSSSARSGRRGPARAAPAGAGGHGAAMYGKRSATIAESSRSSRAICAFSASRAPRCGAARRAESRTRATAGCVAPRLRRGARSAAARTASRPSPLGLTGAPRFYQRPAGRRARPSGRRSRLLRARSGTIHSASSAYSVGTPATWTANSVSRACARVGACAGASSPNRTRERGRASRRRRASRRAAARPSRRAPERLALDRWRGSRAARRACRRRAPTPARRCRCSAISSTSASSPPVRKAAAQHPLEHGRLDRRAHDVGIEADVAEEHAVGGRDGLAPDADRARAADAAGQFAQPRLDVGRRAPGQRAVARAT